MPESTTDSSNDESKDEDEIEQSSKNEWCDLESENFWLCKILAFLLDSLSPPTKEENLIEKWYGCIQEDFSKPKHSKWKTLYIDKVLCQFLSDENGKAHVVDIHCNIYFFIT